MPLDDQLDLDHADLLVRYAQGDRQAARVLTQQLVPIVFAQAFRILKDRAEAEDVAQEALLRLWKIAPEWDAERAKVTTWLFRVTANLCTDRLRKRRRMEPGLDGVAEPQDHAPSVHNRMEDVQRQTALRAAISALPERQRLAVLYRHMEELGNPEIAERLEISVEAVESLLSRGRRALKLALAGKKEALGYSDDG